MLAQSYVTLAAGLCARVRREMADSTVASTTRRLGERTLRDGRELRVARLARARCMCRPETGDRLRRDDHRNAITRSDAIVKIPSKTLLPQLRSRAPSADRGTEPPAHQHLAWPTGKAGRRRGRGADLSPEKIEKIVAWGGFARSST